MVKVSDCSSGMRRGGGVRRKDYSGRRKTDPNGDRKIKTTKVF